MSYYFTTTLTNVTFDEAIDKTVAALINEGFGVLKEIDLKATFKIKLDEDFYNYTILGACNPQFAYNALQAENKIGTMLPCNFIVQEREAGTIEISGVDPMASMISVQNESLGAIASEVRIKLQRVVESIK